MINPQLWNFAPLLFWACFVMRTAERKKLDSEEMEVLFLYGGLFWIGVGVYLNSTMPNLCK